MTTWNEYAEQLEESDDEDEFEPSLFQQLISESKISEMLDDLESVAALPEADDPEDINYFELVVSFTPSDATRIIEELRELEEHNDDQ